MSEPKGKDTVANFFEEKRYLVKRRSQTKDEEDGKTVSKW